MADMNNPMKEILNIPPDERMGKNKEIIINEKMVKEKFYVTTPIYYVNSKPHLGTLYSTVLADVAARWNKLLGKKVFFLTGTDEHGQKVEERALSEKMDPQKFVDSMVEPFKKVWNLYNIEYDHFVRTTDKQHEKAVIQWIEKAKKNGDIYKAAYDGWYCVPCETFVSTEKEKVTDEQGNVLCPSCKRVTKKLDEENYFFRLSAYEEQLLEVYKNNPNFITPKEKLNEVISFVKSGLKDLSISRKGVSWGIPFPGDKDHTVYVWADALNNYISAIGYGQNNILHQKNFEYFWPANVHIMAKDIIRFHAVYWPAFLMSAGLELPKKMLVHGFILVDETKMSKSIGNVVDPEQLAKDYGVDQVRYYLTKNMAITHDGNFSIKSLEETINADLANNVGNLLQRTTSLALKNNLSNVIPKKDNLAIETISLRKKYLEMYRAFSDEINHYFYHTAYSEVFKFISEVNAYVHQRQPWKLIKESKEKFEEVISTVFHSLYAVGILLWPIIPKKAEELLATLGKKISLGSNYDELLRHFSWNETFTITQPKQPLFTKIEKKKTVSDNQQKNNTKNNGQEKKDSTSTISFDDFLKIDLRTGTITSCEPVEKSNKLYKMQVDLGSLGTRQILAGIAKFFKPEELIGKQGIFVANLAPRKLMGLESQGMMVMVQGQDGTLKRIIPSDDVENGMKLS
jgi:methionyl-tRNA synthetase